MSKKNAVPEVVEDEPVVDAEGTVIQPGVRNDRRSQACPEQATPEAIKRSVEEQRAAEAEGRAPDPKISGWDSAHQIAVSPGANPENYLRSPEEVREAGDV